MIPKELIAPLIQAKPVSSSFETKGPNELADQPLPMEEQQQPSAVLEIICEQQNIPLITFEPSVSPPNELQNPVPSSDEIDGGNSMTSSDGTDMGGVMDLINSIQEQVVALQLPLVTEAENLPRPLMAQVFNMVDPFPDVIQKASDVLSGSPESFLQDFSEEDSDEEEPLVGYLEAHHPELSPVIEETEELIFAEMMGGNVQPQSTIVDQDEEIEANNQATIRSQTETQNEPESNLATGPEAELFTEPVVVPESKLEAEPEIKLEIEPEAELIAEPESEPVVEPIMNPEVKLEIEPEAELIAEPESEPVVEPIMNPKTETELGTAPKTEAEPESRFEVEPEAELIAASETGPESELEAEPVVKPILNPEAEPENKSKADPKEEQQNDVPEVEPSCEIKKGPKSGFRSEPQSEPEGNDIFLKDYVIF